MVRTLFFSCNGCFECSIGPFAAPRSGQSGTMLHRPVGGRRACPPNAARGSCRHPGIGVRGTTHLQRMIGLLTGSLHGKPKPETGCSNMANEIRSTNKWYWGNTQLFLVGTGLSSSVLCPCNVILALPLDHEQKPLFKKLAWEKKEETPHHERIHEPNPNG